MTILVRCVAWLAAVALLIITTAGPAAADEHGNTPRLYDTMDTFVRDRMSNAGSPGAAYAIVDRDGIRHSGTFGSDGDGGAVSSETPFLWGSVAKPVTATLVMAMVSAGELRLDAPLTTYLPSFRTRDVERSAMITVRQLLDHTSGLPTSTRHTDRTAPHRRPADVVPELERESLVGAPGVTYRYSSTNYLLLAAVVEAVTGRPFPEVLRDRVLGPLDMRDAVTTAEQARATVPHGHRYVFGRPVPMATPFDPAGVGYGYLGGSVADLAAFARMNLGGGVEVVGPAQRAAMVAGDVPTGPDRSYGLGWRRWAIPGTDTPMVWHGGAVPGFWAQIILLPEHAVVLLANSYGPLHEPKLLNIGFGLAELSLGRQPPESPSTYTYPVVLGAMLAMVVILLGLIVHGVRLLIGRRPATPSRVRTGAVLAGWVLVLGGVLYGFGRILPTRSGVELYQLGLWAPDVAALVFATLIAAGVLLVLRVVIGLRALRR
ncbi:serine hydrolase domain-containing protein [Nocardia vermiculata]|uniref:Beta-lactamase family protein n=1 Tax=Nocardia vermiculata TaxID=257274 RepID=A0A846Y2P1_9NOCA|nr:serine hydrolase domain-containing protein [Nocardia vermiculata]NKY53513.1 beta-lactamase family protein [Nocardia vermiculata]